VDDSLMDNCPVSNANDAASKVHVEPSDIHTPPFQPCGLIQFYSCERPASMVRVRYECLKIVYIVTFVELLGSVTY
jgi:hypothetical protein